MGGVKVAVLGAGLIGKRHVEHLMAEPTAELAAIVDPSPAGKEFALSKGAPWYPSFADMLGAEKPEALIVSTPNSMHVANGLEAVAAGIPTLVEKPIADSIQSGTKLVDMAEKARVPLLVGHHRRHNPMLQKAKAIVESGRLGTIVAVHAFFWLMKPDDYFDTAWHRDKSAGPVLLNLIHDVDCLRYLCGEIVSVQAQSSRAIRGYDAEETAVIIMTFANGALGTVNVSDSVVGAWSWEQNTGENPVYPQADQSCYFIGGTHGSLTIPKLEVWSNKAKRSWWEPLFVERSYAADEDPLRLQVRHLCRVVRGEEKPLVSGREGLNTLKVIDAIKRATQSNSTVRIES